MYGMWRDLNVSVLDGYLRESGNTPENTEHCSKEHCQNIIG